MNKDQLEAARAAQAVNDWKNKVKEHFRNMLDDLDYREKYSREESQPDLLVEAFIKFAHDWQAEQGQEEPCLICGGISQVWNGESLVFCDTCNGTGKIAPTEQGEGFNEITLDRKLRASNTYTLLSKAAKNFILAEVRKYFESLKRSAAAPTSTAGGWVNVSERLPKKGTFYLVQYADDGDTGALFFSTKHNCFGFFSQEYWASSNDVLRWYEAPEPPSLPSPPPDNI